MPELPEVETIRLDLAQSLMGAVIDSVDITDAKLAPKSIERLWRKRLSGRSLRGFTRLGKYLGILIEPDQRLVVHLRMTGQLLVTQKNDTHPRTRLALRFKDQRSLILADVRRFAECWLQHENDGWPSKTLLGPDALLEAKADAFVMALQGRKTPIHNALLDQRILAGVGNIYSQEALFRAGIRPTQRAGRLSRDKREILFKHIQDVLRQALASRGSTLQDYRDANGENGEAQRWHAVYDKNGSACLRCQTRLKAVRLAGRTAVYCGKCQV